MSDSLISHLRQGLRWRLYLAVTALLLTLLGLLAGAVLSLDRVSERFRELVSGPVEEVLTVKDLRGRILGMGLVIHHYVGEDDSLYRERYHRRVQAVELEFQRLSARDDLTPVQREGVLRAQRQWRILRQVVDDLRQRHGTLEHARLTERLEEVATHLSRIANTLDRVSDESIDRLHEEVRWSSELRREVVVVLAALVVGGVFLALSAGAGLARSLALPLRELEAHRDTGLERAPPAPLLPPDTGERDDRSLAHDPLTGLYSFRQFHELAEREIHRATRYNRPFALLLVDIDDFRRVNQQYGYLAGDSVLCTVASRIQASVRPTDVAARYGGEEISVLLAEIDEEGALETAERIRRTVADSPLNMGEARWLRVTVSVGVALFPDDAEDLPRLLQWARQALEAAQASGGNRVCSWSELTHFA